jgi:hypothetical protein
MPKIDENDKNYLNISNFKEKLKNNEGPNIK